MHLQPLHLQTSLAAARRLLIDTERRLLRLCLNGRLCAFFLVLCLLTGCAIDRTQDVRFVNDSLGGSTSTTNVSWTQVVGIERGLPGDHDN
ncbi:MAG: hypothetical protein VBE63_27320 [Lamprobacter sp.]|uniref:hypothetical protein n=1 Tax=Lamprobacter sp. TaxID=3100796 RepID=UPI002B256B0C|nr:hypothetical protein [Lamprobacter sp.]MEA3643610.1 hypothetical protein [Lamprobacter sp.]